MVRTRRRTWRARHWLIDDFHSPGSSFAALLPPSCATTVVIVHHKRHGTSLSRRPTGWADRSTRRACHARCCSLSSPSSPSSPSSLFLLSLSLSPSLPRPASSFPIWYPLLGGHLSPAAGMLPSAGAGNSGSLFSPESTFPRNFRLVLRNNTDLTSIRYVSVELPWFGGQGRQVACTYLPFPFPALPASFSVPIARAAPLPLFGPAHRPCAQIACVIRALFPLLNSPNTHTHTHAQPSADHPFTTRPRSPPPRPPRPPRHTIYGVTPSTVPIAATTCSRTSTLPRAGPRC